MRNHRFLRDHQGALTLAKNSRHPRKHAGAQSHLPVVNTATNTHRAAIGVDQWVHRLHHRREPLTRQCIKADHCRLAFFDLVLKALGQSEINKHGINVFDVHHVGAVFQVVTDIGRANAGDAVKRRKHLQPCGRSPGKCQLGVRHFQIGRAFIDRTLADEVLLDQLLIALVVGQRNGKLGLALLHLRELKLVVKLHQQLSFFDAVTIAEVELCDASTDLGAHDHPLARAQAAHRLGVVGQAADFYLGHFHTRRPRCRCATCRRA